jgi:proteasome lid subunit RPN8/RPN11
MSKSKVPEVIGLPAVNEAIIYPHIFQNADREVGGVLVGRASRAGGLPLITGAIAALKADEQRATLTFTQDAWEHVHRTLDRDFPAEEQIVGWYHSHPGFGIFLSEHDLFIHRNFFGGPSQIAVVVDPLAGTEGVFAWRDDRIVPVIDRPTPAAWPGLAGPSSATAAWPGDRVPSSLRDDAPTPRKSPYPFSALAAAALAGVALGLAAWQVVPGEQKAASTTARTTPSTTAAPATTQKTPATPQPRHHPQAVEPVAGETLPPPEDEGDGDGDGAAPTNPSN